VSGVQAAWAFGVPDPLKFGNPVLGAGGLASASARPNADYAAKFRQHTFHDYQVDVFAIITRRPLISERSARANENAAAMVCLFRNDPSGALLVYFSDGHHGLGQGGFPNAFLGAKVPHFRFRAGGPPCAYHVPPGSSSAGPARLYLGKAVGHPSRIIP